MPNIIKILPQFLANRIAAGEVVGRPESVVKELMENSIDAGAKNIFLRIKDSGKSFIQIIDDGFGMTEEDTLICFQRHSTSKIHTAEDLENIRTLGFRGEALASITAVAQVEIKSRTLKDELGTVIKNNGNEIIEHTNEHAPVGTSILVKNLFFNTPARRNFLKSDQTEFKHIYETFVRLAVSHPQIGFIFLNEDVEVFNLIASDLSGRIQQIFGDEYSQNMVEINFNNNLINIFGYISKPTFTKRTKQDQLLFLNHRYVISKSLSYAVHLAYQDLIDKGEYPNFFIFISLDPVKFDVNVHPSKLEVKFEDEKSVFNLLRKCVIESLHKNDLVFKVKLDDDSSQNNFNNAGNFTKSADRGKFNHASSTGFSGSDKQSNIHKMYSGKLPFKKEDYSDGLINYDSTLSENENKTNEFTQTVSSEIKSKNLIWQFQKKYIMYQLDNTLMIIDQHAAHERILYEKAVVNLNSNANLSQQLLIPIYVVLNTIDFELLKSIKTELSSLGFDIEVQSNRKIKIVGIPSDVRIGNEEKILQQMLDEYKVNEVKLNLEKRDNLAKSYACKHAIKTGDSLSENEMLNLIDTLFLTEMPYVCPHGRPTIIKIPIDELDKKFARTGNF